MGLSDRAAAAAPYVQQLLYDQKTQDAARRAATASRESYRRARGKSARKALNDKRLRRRAAQAVAASAELVSAVSRPAPRRSRRGRMVIALAVAAAVATLALNGEVRGRVLDLLGGKDANTVNPPQ
jgi:hypothetical protein